VGRQRSLDVPIKAAALAFCLALVGGATADAEDAPAPSSEPASAGRADGDEPIERRPYHIALHLAADVNARIDGSLRDALVDQWRALVTRFIGPAWRVDVVDPPSSLVGDGLARLKVEDFGDADPAFDKTWLVWIGRDPKDFHLVLSGREYDAAARWLGPLQTRRATSPADLTRALLDLSTDLFSPSALIVGQEGGGALLKVQGAAIAPASPLGTVVAKGTTFIPLRLVSMRDGTTRVNRIAYSYLVTQSVEGSTARCSIVSAFRDPLTQRIARPNTLAAIGVKPGNVPLRLRFVTRADKSAAAGYTLTERAAPDGPPHEVGITDRSGRITVAPGLVDGVVKLRLLAGGGEPLAEFPMMPGESAEEREIAIDPLPLAADYQVKLDALRDQIVDQVALRGRLERLMQARADGEDWEGLDALLKEYAKLPSSATFAETLKRLKDEATKRAYEATKSTVLTKNLQARFSDLEGLIDGYLADDAYNAYADALRQKKANDAQDAKAAESKPSSAPEPAPAAPAPAADAPAADAPATPTKPAAGNAAPF